MKGMQIPTDKCPLTMAEFRTEVALRRRLRWPTKILHSLIRGEREVTRLGARWRLDYSTPTGKVVIKKSYSQRAQTEHFFSEAVQRGCEIFLDIGANVGYYSIIAARMGIFKEIHAFEPAPENFARLRWHISANGFENLIHPYPVAVSDHAREVVLVNARNIGAKKDGVEGEGMSVSSDPEAKTRIDARMAQAAPLDSMLELRGEKLAVKMDIESHEVPALVGGKNLFMKNSVFLQVEIRQPDAATANHLLTNGFRMLTYIPPDFYFENESSVS